MPENFWHPSGALAVRDPVGDCWMPGVFRELRHWVPVGSHRHNTPVGPTYYAIAPCNSPCIYVPENRTLGSTWRQCPVCLNACAPPEYQPDLYRSERRTA